MAEPLKGSGGRSYVRTEKLHDSAFALAKALDAAGWGHLPITSAYRDPSHNQRVDGASKSQHIEGRAFDIVVAGLSDAEKAKLLSDAVDAGVRGVGIYPGGNTLHIDTRVGSPVTWGPGADPYDGVDISRQPRWAQPILARMIEGKVQMAEAPLKIKVPAPKPDASGLDPAFEKMMLEGMRDEEPVDKNFEKEMSAALGFDPARGPSSLTRPGERSTAGIVAELQARAYGVDAGKVEKELVEVEKAQMKIAEAKKERAKLAEGVFDKRSAVLQGLALGLAPNVLGAIQATENALKSGTTKNWKSDYKGSAEVWKDAYEGYKETNPGEALVGEAAGSMAGLGGAQAAAGRALMRAAPPATGGAINFLAGNRGVLSQMTGGAISGAVGGGLSTNLGTGDVGKDALTGAVVGAAMGPAVGGLVNYLSPRAVPTRARGEMAQSLVRQGVPVKAVQLVGDAVPDNAPDQIRAFSAAVADRLDVGDLIRQGDTFTRDVVDLADARLGGRFSAAINQMGGRVAVDRQFIQALTRVARDVASKHQIEPAKRNFIIGGIRDIMTAVRANGGALTGEQFTEALRFKGAVGSMMGNADPTVKGHGQTINDAMMDWLERSAGPEAAEMLRDAKGRWRDYVKLKPALEKAVNNVANGAEGLLDPADVARAASKGTDQLKEIATGAKLIPTPKAAAKAEDASAILEWAKRNPVMGGAAGLLGVGGASNFPAIASAGGSLIAANPAVTSFGALGALGGIAGEAARRHAMNQPGYRDGLIRNALRGGTEDYAGQYFGPIGGLPHLWGEPAAPGQEADAPLAITIQGGSK